MTMDQKWDAMKTIIKETAAETISKDKKEPRSPETRKAYSLLQRKLNKTVRNDSPISTNVASKRLEQEANLNKPNAYRCIDSTVSEAEKTFKFQKQHKKKPETQKSTTSLSYPVQMARVVIRICGCGTEYRIAFRIWRRTSGTV